MAPFSSNFSICLQAFELNHKAFEWQGRLAQFCVWIWWRCQGNTEHIPVVSRVHTGIPESNMKDPSMPCSVTSVGGTVASETGSCLLLPPPAGTALALPMASSLLLYWPPSCALSHLAGPSPSPVSHHGPWQGVGVLSPAILRVSACSFRIHTGHMILSDAAGSICPILNTPASQGQGVVQRQLEPSNEKDKGKKGLSGHLL